MTPLSHPHSHTHTLAPFCRKNPGEYDADYGFLALFHGMERPNKLVIRTFHRWARADWGAYSLALVGMLLTEDRKTMPWVCVEPSQNLTHSLSLTPRRFKFNLAAAHKRIAKARHGIMDTVRM